PVCAEILAQRAIDVEASRDAEATGETPERVTEYLIVADDVRSRKQMNILAPDMTIEGRVVLEPAELSPEQRLLEFPHGAQRVEIGIGSDRGLKREASLDLSIAHARQRQIVARTAECRSQ